MRGAACISNHPLLSHPPPQGQGGDHEVQGSLKLLVPQATPHPPQPAAAQGPATPHCAPPTSRPPGRCGALRGAARLRGAGRRRSCGQTRKLRCHRSPGKAAVRRRFWSRARSSSSALQHGCPAADPAALLRCAVPLLLAGFRGEAGLGSGRAEGRANAGRSATLPRPPARVSCNSGRCPLPSRALGHADRQRALQGWRSLGLGRTRGSGCPQWLEKGQRRRIKEEATVPPLLSTPLSVSEGWNADQDGNPGVHF